ncbi:MFS general substrate transporter [Diaporthe amygdali]|uniref:MFS general substrate transporter n=1 Tax=Phomopsis amygdali TaxID=1214568 RepID=UPI0022FEDCB9|nr:MFS general substrate transporter [Diaporthe amygdali]KAJ0115724.1 MFS general substrate transporter [Diaporthe amygdali]
MDGEKLDDMDGENIEQPAEHTKTTEENNNALPVQVTAYKPGARAPLTKTRFWLVLLSIETGMLAVAVDFYTIPIAVPWLSSGDLGYMNSVWLSTAFLVSFALGLLIWPRLFAGFSYKCGFFMAMGAFNIANGRAMVSKTTESMLRARLVQGVGAGGVCGLFDIILREIVPMEEFGKYMSVSRMIWAAAAVASPLMGGALIEYIDGRFCFMLCILPGQISYYLALFCMKLPEPSWSQMVSSFRQFDYLGTLCLSAGTVCMLLATVSSNTYFPWVPAQFPAVLVSGLAFLTAFFIIEPLVPDPILHPSLIHNSGLLMIIVAAFFYGANLVGTMYYVPHFFQLALQGNAMISGVSILPMMLGLGMSSTASAFISSRYRTKSRIAHVGAALQALASGLMTRWNTDTSCAETTVILAILGLGQGTTMIGLLHAAQASVNPPAVGTATRLFGFAQASGHTFGVACFATLYTKKLRSSLAGLLLPVEASLADVQKLTDDSGNSNLINRFLDAYGSSMQHGWWLMFACAVFVLVLSFFVEQRKLHDDVSLPTLDGRQSLEAEKGP